MIVCITEKPSVARDIARVLGANEKHEGYFEGNGYKVTWTYGHLCTLKDPSDYKESWKKWSLGSLPMVPPRFGIKLIENDGYKRQFEVISTLVKDADEVINCGDAGQEGELIQRWVLQKAGTKCKIKRLWISSLTDESIKEGFKNLRESAEYDNLYEAGLSRAIGDWLLGINSTRLYSLRYSSGKALLSVGRVQTPTLAMIVQRQREIDNFESANYWEIRLMYRDVTFLPSPPKKYQDEEKGKSVIEELRGTPFTITGIENKKSKESPPRLFDLTSLQVESNNKFGWSADETLKLIQSLYEKKLTTYPRVDTTYLSEDMYPKIPEILKKLTHYKRYVEPIQLTKLSKSKKIFDNSKVTDHHAIIPTGESPSKLIDPKERQLFHLITQRFLANFYPDCEFNVTTVTGDIKGKVFRATGRTIVRPGWRDIYNNDVPSSSESKEEDAVLPDFIVGEIGPCKLQLQKKTTQPPKHFTEATLLKAMETAGKNIDNEELREAMKENGIGRPSTRSAIIETLIKRGYVERKRKKLMATEAGKTLIDTIKDELLKSPKLTGIWENRLRRIEKGEYSATEFIDKLKLQLKDIITGVLNDSQTGEIITGK